VAEIVLFGTIVRTKLVTEFVPSPWLQIETQISKAMPRAAESINTRQELHPSKIATVTQIPENVVSQIL
jgi:hypothetical protein